MKKLLPILLLLAVGLWAADFWQSKPYTDWSDKDLQKMLNSSPWSRPVSVPLGGAGVPSGGGGKGKGGGGGGGEGTGRGGRGGMEDDNGPQSLNVLLRWQMALPVRQALVRQKYGAEAATSPDAKKFMEQQVPGYVIVLSMLPARFGRGAGDQLVDRIKEDTTLSAKGKDKLKPNDVRLVPGEKYAEVQFLFPNTTPFTLEDKDVEFSTKLGRLVVQCRFHLKDMVYNGKLEL